MASVDELSKKKIPEEVMKRAGQSLLDYLAVASAGTAFQSEKLEKYFAFSMPEEGSATTVGLGKKLALKETVFLNGLNGHALDFDDGTNAGIIHLGSPVFSLLLPLGERYSVSVEELLEAAVLGYEVSYTLAVSIQPVHKAMGFHATGTCGTVGAAVAAAYMLHFSEKERYNVFGAACVAASGMLKVLDDGSELKPYNVAKTALLALTALQMGKAGFEGHEDPLGGRGFLKMMTGKDVVELKPLLQNGTYAIQKTYTKPYASCRYTHPSIEAAICLRNENGLKAEEIRSVAVHTYALAVGGHDHTEIPGSYSAKMSIPYSVAAGLVYGKAGLKEFSEDNVQSKLLKELTSKVTVTADDAMSQAFPAVQTARIEITAEDGRVYSKQVDFPKGEPQNPLTDEEFLERYKDLMAYGNIPENTADRIFEDVIGGRQTAGGLMARFAKM